MERIKKSSKFGRAYLDMYARAKATSIRQLYKQPSRAKVRAEEDCLQKMAQEHGEGYKILSYNMFKFTAAWRTTEGLRVETAGYSYLIF